MPSAANRTVHQLKISLQGAAPPLWRRIQLPSEASLGFLHDVIQQAFGWDDSHLHRFEGDRGREWGDPSRDSGFFGPPVADEEDAALSSVAPAAGSALWYEYDFGDSWRHKIDVEKIIPLDPGVTYPRCAGGRRAAPPAEDIGGVWGLEEVVYLVEHPGETPPEHFEDLVSHLRKTGYDPRAFDPAELSRELSGLALRTAAGGTGKRSRRQVQRLTSDDVTMCTCGHCQPGDPVRSFEGGFLTEEVSVEAEVFPAVTLPPVAELAAQARRAPLVADALLLAEWCAAGRPVTAKGVLKPALAREAVEDLGLWRRDAALADPDVRADVLGHLRSAGDVPALDVPWQFALRSGLIAIRSGRAFPGAGVSGRKTDEELLSFWEKAFTAEIDALDELGAGIMPGLLGMMGEYFDSAVFPVLQVFYRHQNGGWLDVAGLLEAFELDGSKPGNPLLVGFIVETASQLLKILSDFGAADVDQGTIPWRGEYAAIGLVISDLPLELPNFRLRLTPLGTHGVRNLLLRDGHTARLAGELAAVDAATLLDELDVADLTLDSEVSGWVAARGEQAAVAQLLEAVEGTAVDLARRRVAAIAVLTLLKPDGGRDALRAVAENGPDGSRQVAAGVLVNLGEEPPRFGEAARQWLLVDLLAAFVSVEDQGEVPAELLELIRPQADNLWRGDHPAAADLLEAAAEAIRDTDKALAKQLRRSAHKARARR
jgi:hypothetical protein